jgi:hypothetical protein
MPYPDRIFSAFRAHVAMMQSSAFQRNGRSGRCLP